MPECYGWTVSMEDGDELVELNGDDFVLDAIGELELPPAFPGTRASFRTVVEINYSSWN